MMTRNRRPTGVACIRGGEENPCLKGTVEFSYRGGMTLVVADIEGLPETEANFFALHIHAGGDCQGSGFPNTGSHYNPCEKAHPMHAGDLPPLLRCRGGKAWLAVVTDRFRVEDVIGRTVVIHSHPDDFKTQPSGDAGSKIGCGVIR